MIRTVAVTSALAAVLLLWMQSPERIEVTAAESLLETEAALDGFHGRERFLDRPTRWTNGNARIVVPISPLRRITRVQVTAAGFPGRADHTVTILAVGLGLARATLHDGFTEIDVSLGRRATPLADDLVVMLRSPGIESPPSIRRVGVRFNRLVVDTEWLPLSTAWRSALAWLGLPCLALAVAGFLGSVIGGRVAALVGMGAMFALFVAGGSSLRGFPGGSIPFFLSGFFSLCWLLTARARRTAPSNRSTWAWLLGLLLATAPLALLSLWVLKAAVDVPRYDSWELMPRIEAFRHGTLTLQSLALQSTQHRSFFMRLVLVPLASWSGWNVNYEIACSLVTAMLTYLLLLWRLTAAAMPARMGAVAAAASSVVVFSGQQFENWLWGYQFEAFLMNLGVVGAALAFASVRRSWWSLLVAGACGIVATYSFAPGLLVWPAGLALLAGLRGHQRRWKMLFWSLLSAAVVWSYFADYVTPMGYETVGLRLHSLAALGELALKVITFLGMPLTYADELWRAGVGWRELVTCGIGAAGAIALALIATRRLLGPDGWAGVETSTVLGAVGVGTALVAALGRASLDTPGGLVVSRYTTIGNLVWLALILDIAQSARLSGSTSSARPANRRSIGWRSAAAPALAAAIAVGALPGWWSSRRGFENSWEVFNPARHALASGQISPALTPLIWDYRLMADWVPVLKRERLSVFRDEPVP
ncbi:MAG: hypothetical protein ACRD2X_20260 [Vicinamibacteraceae bacterium]